MKSIGSNLKEILAELPQQVQLVAVSKYRPLEQLQQAYDAGQRIFAENRPLELDTKAKALPKDIQWHFIGHLQTNKLRFVLPHASLIHSVDSTHLMDAIEKWASAADRNINILLEIHIGREEAKQGFTEAEALALCEAVNSSRQAGEAMWPHLKICGLMGMASHTDEVGMIDADFARIESLWSSIKKQCTLITEFRELSIGMSGDYPIALKHNATMVRIGSAIFDTESL